MPKHWMCNDCGIFHRVMSHTNGRNLAIGVHFLCAEMAALVLASMLPSRAIVMKLLIVGLPNQAWSAAGLLLGVISVHGHRLLPAHLPWAVCPGPGPPGGCCAARSFATPKEEISVFLACHCLASMKQITSQGLARSGKA